MKIHTYILRQHRMVEKLKVKPKKGFFVYNGGIYCVTNSVTLKAKEDPSRFNTVPELFFYQDNPVPVNEKAKTGPEFLEEMVIENALRDTGKPRHQPFVTLVKTLTNPSRLLGLGVAVGVALILLRFALTGGV